MSQKATTDDNAKHFADILGMAIVQQWHALGQDAQRLIFEAAVDRCGRADDSEFREALAIFLHAHHPRTEAD